MLLCSLFSARDHRTPTVATNQNPPQEIQPPSKPVPLTELEDLKQELPGIVEKAVDGIIHDKFHQLPTSRFGSTLIDIAHQLVPATTLIMCIHFDFRDKRN